MLEEMINESQIFRNDSEKFNTCQRCRVKDSEKVGTDLACRQKVNVFFFHFCLRISWKLLLKLREVQVPFAVHMNCLKASFKFVI